MTFHYFPGQPVLHLYEYRADIAAFSALLVEDRCLEIFRYIMKHIGTSWGFQKCWNSHQTRIQITEGPDQFGADPCETCACPVNPLEAISLTPGRLQKEQISCSEKSPSSLRKTRLQPQTPGRADSMQTPAPWGWGCRGAAGRWCSPQQQLITVPGRRQILLRITLYFWSQ